MSFPHLFSPLRLGPLTVTNRAIMSSMHTGLEDNPDDFDALAALYALRAANGVQLIITGGFSPTKVGALTRHGATLTKPESIRSHAVLTSAVHKEGGHILAQLLHAGRYAYTPDAVGASNIQSPISPFVPRSLGEEEVHQTVESFVEAARLARDAGYDGVEIMGSEGYLINQFLAARTNKRTDFWGGTAEKRMRFPEAIVREVRAALGPNFVISYRISLADLVPEGQTLGDVLELARKVEAAGATFFNTGIGWHEAQVPTIVTSVPRANFAAFTAALRSHVTVPVSASNRINTPQTAEMLLETGVCDLVSMARPFLADPEFLSKAELNQPEAINICIACNQACLDHTFANAKASCMLNPQAGRERELALVPVPPQRRHTVAVVGAGPAGLAAATSLAKRGHAVTLFEQGASIGGQFRLAMQIPGKEEFRNTLTYYENQLRAEGVRVRLNQRVGAADLKAFDNVFLATGVTPRRLEIPGIDHSKVVYYDELLRGEQTAGASVAVIGAGGIGYDVAEYLIRTPLGHSVPTPETPELFDRHWGISDDPDAPGSLQRPHPPTPERKVYLLQRKEKFGSTLGKTTGWVHKATLKAGGITQFGSVRYELIDDAGLHLRLADGTATVLDVETIVICAGQESVRDIDIAGMRVIGGAYKCAELDAKAAILQATTEAAQL